MFACYRNGRRQRSSVSNMEARIMHHTYSYEAALSASETVNWRVEDLIGGGRELDFSKPFLPESLARVTPLSFLTQAEQRTLNQIRGHGYL